MSRTRTERGPFRVGDHVVVPFVDPIIGQIVAERGPLGRDGEHLYDIRLPMDPDDPDVITLGADVLIRAERDSTDPGTSRIVDYLKQGGLVPILRANLGGSPTQPQVWFRLGNLGQVVHTFDPSRGVRGGWTVPFSALHGPDRIFAPKVDEVASFLRSFGLDEVQADEVIRAVGTAP